MNCELLIEVAVQSAFILYIMNWNFASVFLHKKFIVIFSWKFARKAGELLVK